MIALPTDRATLAQAVKSMFVRGDAIRRTRLPEWIINAAFLQGVRDFNAIDYTTGQVRYRYVNQNGKLRFRNEEILRDLQVEMGRFLGIDVRPSVKMLGWGLDRLRAAAVGQVILDHAASEAVLSRIRVPFMESLLVYGCCGISGWVQNAGALSGRSTLEVVPPWELMPIPYNASSPATAQGLIRTRMVPLEAIRRSELLGEKLKGKTNQDLEVREVEWGEMETASGSMGSPAGDVLGTIAGGYHASMGEVFDDAAAAGKHKEGKEVVRLIEVWLHGPEGKVTRYIVMVGKVILRDDDFEKDGMTVYLPIGMARYYQHGFWGRSYAGPLVPFTSETEKALEAVFQGLRDMDAMGIMGLPMSLGLTPKTFRIGGKPRRFFYQVDPLDRMIQPLHFAPKPIGPFAKHGMDITREFTSKVAGQSPLLSGEAPGRADSAAAFGFLLETSNVGIEAPGNSIADAWTMVYTAMLAASKFRLTKQDLTRVLTLDTMPVGVVLDKTGKFAIDKNPIPDPETVSINIKSRTPPSKAQRAMQLREMLITQIITPEQYRLVVYREGLDLPVANEAEYQAWRKARLNIRTLFNDGKTPAADLVAVDTEADIIQIHLDELQAFMASPEYSLASAAVKDAFLAFKDQFLAAIAKFPGPMPTPDEVADMGPPGPSGPPGGGPPT